MHETSDLESYGKGHRTFDCPWCGAISGIDPSHIGEHFECPECRKATKLTPANTRQRDLTEPPKEAPHHEEGAAGGPVRHETSDWESYGRGHRNFDCPWCGAISGVDPSHLGEPYRCPECHRETKLTSDNTRGGPVTEAPPDAPHVEESKSHAGLLLVAALVVVVGIVAVVASNGGGDDPEGTAENETDVARHTDVTDGVEEPPLEPAPPGPGVPPPGDGAGVTPPEEQPTEVAPPGETQPEEQPVEPAVGPEQLEAAKLDLERAKQELADWEAAHPEVAEMLGLLKACTDVRCEATRLCETYPGPDATQEEARAYNAVMRVYVGADPKRVEAATRIVDALNSERLKPRFLDSWEGVNFYLPHVRKTMGQLEAAGECVESKEYGALRRRVNEAELAVEKASAGG